MINSLIVSYKLKNAYKTNSTIFSIFQLPFLKSIDSKEFYKNEALKKLFGIISLIITFFKNIFLKAIYLALIAFFPILMTTDKNMYAFITAFLLLVPVVNLFKNYMFNPTKEKYYALTLINMNTKSYVLSNYIIDIIKDVISFIVLMPLLSYLIKIPIGYCLLLIIYEIFIKLIVSSFNLLIYETTKKISNHLNNIINFTISSILIAIMFILIYNDLLITSKILYIIITISSILTILSIIKISNFKYYKIMYRQLLNKDTLFETSEQIKAREMKNSSMKAIQYDKNYTTNKTGFAFFHDLFVNRHRKILQESAKRQSIVIIIIIGIIITVSFASKEMAEEINDNLMYSLPYFFLIMYAINRGIVVTQAMFMNCDHSLLTYKFYRKPDVILGLFKERLKTLITIDLQPASIIAISLPIILFITGGTSNNLNYLILFISIIAMSIFFSVHNLVLYYLFQPYNINTEAKSATLRIAQVVTYYVCFYISDLRLPTFLFGLSTIIFCIIYIIISTIIIYKYAPKTFKLR